jgi:hypothetical protein
VFLDIQFDSPSKDTTSTVTGFERNRFWPQIFCAGLQFPVFVVLVVLTKCDESLNNFVRHGVGFSIDRREHHVSLTRKKQSLPPNTLFRR